MQDNHAYAFNKTDAQELVQLIGGADQEYPIAKRIPQRAVVCYTPGGGIAARSGTTVSSAACSVVSRSGSTLSTGSNTLSVYNLSTTAVAASVYIVAVPTNIGFVAVWEDC